MVDYREILRLNSLKYTQRQIAASVHSSRNTISVMDILALGNCGSGKMETGVPDTETILVGLIVSSHGTRNCQARSRFAVCKQA